MVRLRPLASAMHKAYQLCVCSSVGCIAETDCQKVEVDGSVNCVTSNPGLDDETLQDAKRPMSRSVASYSQFRPRQTCAAKAVCACPAGWMSPHAPDALVELARMSPDIDISVNLAFKAVLERAMSQRHVSEFVAHLCTVLIEWSCVWTGADTAIALLLLVPGCPFAFAPARSTRRQQEEESQAKQEQRRSRVKQDRTEGRRIGRRADRSPLLVP